MTTKNVSVRLAAVGGKQVKAELSEIGQEGARSFQQLERSAVGSGAGLQNVGFQVQDFAVQVAGGTDATRALAQQLPQLLSGFGLWGVAIGTATAVLVPLTSYLMGANEEAQDLDKTLRNMEASVRDLKAITEQYTLTGIVELTEKYGELNAEVLKLIERKDQMDLANALGQAKDAIAGVRAEFDGMFSSTQGNEADFLGIQMQIPMLNEFGDAIIGINPQLAEFESLMQAVADAQTLDAQAAAAARLLDFLEGTAAEGGELWNSLVQVQDQLTQMAASGAENAGWLSSIVASAGDLASTMWDAASASWSFTQAATKRAAAEASLDTFKTAGAYQLYADTRMAAPDVPVMGPKPRKSGGSRGGGGGRVSDDERAAERIFKSTRTEAEKYAAELEKIEDLHGKNLISDDTYARALDNLSDSTHKAADAAKSMESSFGDAFTSFITGAQSAQEAVGNLLSSLAETLANSAFQTISEGLFGKKGVGGWFSGLFGMGGGKAGGGPVRAGMSYLVGEAGTERFTPMTDGYITPNAALRSGQSAGPVINIDARGAQAGVAEQIAAALQAAAPQIIKQSVAASRGAAGRGY